MYYKVKTTDHKQLGKSSVLRNTIHLQSANPQLSVCRLKIYSGPTHVLVHVPLMLHLPTEDLNTLAVRSLEINYVYFPHNNVLYMMYNRRNIINVRMVTYGTPLVCQDQYTLYHCSDLS